MNHGNNMKIEIFETNCSKLFVRRHKKSQINIHVAYNSGSIEVKKKFPVQAGVSILPFLAVTLQILILMFLDVNIQVVPFEIWLRVTHSQRQKTPKVASVLLFRHILKTKSWLECGSSLFNSRMWPGILRDDTQKKLLDVISFLLQIQRKEVEDHLQTSTTLHMEWTLKNLKAATDKLDYLQKQVQELTVTNSTLRMKVDEQSKTIARLNEESLSFVWRVTGFWEILRQAKNKCNKRIKCDPVYAGRQGYKLRLCIEPDGNQSNRNRYLAVYILLMKGDFDGMLP